MRGPQQTRRDTCRPLQARSFVGQLCMCSKWALPARRHWGAHFMVSPLTAVACVCVCVCVEDTQNSLWVNYSLKMTCVNGHHKSIQWSNCSRYSCSQKTSVVAFH